MKDTLPLWVAIAMGLILAGVVAFRYWRITHKAPEIYAWAKKRGWSYDPGGTAPTVVIRSAPRPDVDPTLGRITLGGYFGDDSPGRPGHSELSIDAFRENYVLSRLSGGPFAQCLASAAVVHRLLAEGSMRLDPNGPEHPGDYVVMQVHATTTEGETLAFVLTGVRGATPNPEGGSDVEGIVVWEERGWSLAALVGETLIAERLSEDIRAATRAMGRDLV